MITLGDIDKIAQNICSSQLKVIKALYVIAFGVEPPPRRARKDLKNFSGFNLQVDSLEFKDKVAEVVNRCDVSDLVAVCNVLTLEYQGNKEDLGVRICSLLNDLELEGTSATKDDEDDEEKTEDECENDDDGTRSVASKLNSFALTFRYIEDSIKSFDGSPGYPITKWILDFEEIAELTQWNDLQKLIFAKKSLSGLAKLFVQSQGGVKSWSILKKRLIEEFEQTVSSSQVHKMLMTRKQKKEESVQEYTLVMREIASRANVENEAIIQYIIDGILDDQVHKYVLYGAKTFFDFKEKVKVYEQMKAGEAGQKQRTVIIMRQDLLEILQKGTFHLIIVIIRRK